MSNRPATGRHKESTASACITILFVFLFAACSLVPPSAPGAAARQVDGPLERYFAEGYTGPGFQEYIALANRSKQTSEVLLRFMFNSGEVQEEFVEVRPESRYTVNVNRTVGENREVSTIVSSSTNDLVVERPMYFDYLGLEKDGHTLFGATAPATTWYFAEGYTGPGFDEYICVLNPDAAAASLDFSFQTASKGEVQKTGLTVAGNSRSTFKVNDLLGENYESSLRLESDSPVVAERPMYFDYLGTANHHWAGGCCVIGTQGLSRSYYFAEGTTRPGFEEWLALQNPGSQAIEVDATYQLGPGQGEPLRTAYTVKPRSRATVFVPNEVGPSKDVSVVLQSDAPFLAERSIYYEFTHSGLIFQGGDCATGATSPTDEIFFAEGYTGAAFEEWLTFQNTTDEAAVVEVRYLAEEAARLPPKVHGVPPHSRVTVFVNEDAGPGFQVATDIRVLSGPQIVIERPIYFDPYLWALPVTTDTNVLYGLCFSPYLRGDPRTGTIITMDEIHRLINIITPYTHWVRTFGAQAPLSGIPPLAKEHSLGVAAGCDIWSDRSRNEREVEALIEMANNGYVDIAVVGDEAHTTEAIPVSELVDYVGRVKAAGMPTGTSETWQIWLEHPELVAICDVVIVNIYPFWEGIAVEDAVPHIVSAYEQVRAVAGGKRIILETGWPSGGQTVGQAVPGFDNQARFVSEFISWAHVSGVEYFYFEAFNEDWKRSVEGPCGACWGIWDSEGALKQPVGAVLAPKF